MNTPQIKAPRFLAMSCEEPFRIFFPLGLASGILGLALWPLFFAGALPVYPAVMHARLMTEGFMAAFIVGFLGTAGPRLLAGAHFTAGELGAVLALHLGTIAAHLAAQTALGDGLFCAQLTALAVILGRRFIARSELPPPNFVLVGGGLLCGATGAAIVAFTSVVPDWPRLYTFGVLAVSQGFVLLPVLGVGVFLFPRFLGVSFGSELSELRKPSPAWTARAWCAAISGALIVGSFALEAAGYLRVGAAVRFGTGALYVISQMPAVLKLGRAPLLGQCIRAAVWMLLLGLLWPVFLPAYRVAGLHLLFIGGFMLTVFAVATRVMLGHSGQIHLCKKPLPFLVVSSVFLITGLGARIGADFMPTINGRTSHLVWAAMLCIVAAVVWGIRLVPRVFVPDEEE